MKRFWIEELETMPAPEMARRQLGMVAEQTTRAARDSDFYRDRLGEPPAGGFAFVDLDHFAQAVAPTTKEQVIAAQRDRPPYGGLLAVPEDDLVRHYVYPAGQVLGWSATDHAVLEDMYATGLYAAGVRSTDRVDVTFQYHWVVAGTIWDAAARHLGAAVVPGGAGESRQHANNMALLRTTCLIGFSTFLEHIVASAEEIGIAADQLGVQKIIIVGEWHGSDAKTRLSKLYGGATVREAYGTGETGLVAAECDADSRGMHVHPDVLLEVRNESSGELVDEGEGGEVYLTPLTIRAMPVLRFRTGDITESVRHEPCACGRTTPRLGRIIGRTGQMLRVKGIFLSRPLVESVVAEVLSTASTFQMTVDRPNGLDRLRLKVESPSAVSEEMVTRLVRGMKARATIAIEVDIVPVGTLGEPVSWFVDERT